MESEIQPIVEGNVVIRQTVLPQYRASFFRQLSKHCAGKLILIAGDRAEQGVHVSNSNTGFEVVQVKNRSVGSGVFQLHWQTHVAKQIELLQPSIVVTDLNMRLVDTNSLIKRMHRLGVPVIGWGLGSTNFFGHPFVRVRNALRRHSLARFDGLIAYGSVAARQFQEELNLPTEKVRIAVNSVTCRKDVVDSSDLTAGPLRILTVGRLIEGKRFDVLIDAVAMAQNELLEISGRSLELIIVGDGPLLDSIRQLATRLHVNVRFEGAKHGSDLRHIASGCELFVLPGLGGLAIQEAMSCGLPVVVGKADGTEVDLVRGNGWIVDGSAEEIAHAIVLAERSPDVTAEFGRESARICRDEVNVEQMAVSYATALEHYRRRFRRRTSAVSSQKNSFPDN